VRRGELIICAHHWLIFHFAECGNCGPCDVEFNYHRFIFYEKLIRSHWER